MEALAISAANLNTIEENLGQVAHELSGVITNVNNVNSHVDEVDKKVTDLNDEIKNLVKEIQETTIITNARQNIMYNNSIIEKQYGYYDKVRRNTIALIDSTLNSEIEINSLINLKNEILLNNPNYWLANALAATINWILNDKTAATKEMNNALKKDETKSSLYFCLINLKLNRTDTSIRWLNKYLSSLNPMKIESNFITVLDLISTGTFGNEQKDIAINKIKDWFKELNSEKHIEEKQIDKWYEFLKTKQSNSVSYENIELYTNNSSNIYNNINTTNSFKNIKEYFEKIIYTNTNNETIDELLNNLIYDYETNEKKYQKDNLKNNLIIECNGDRQKALELYNKQESIYDEEQDIITLFSNIVIYRDSYKISNETVKFTLAFIKKYIIESINKLCKTLTDSGTEIKINDFNTYTIDGKNYEEVKKDLDNYIESKFIASDKDLLLIVILANIFGIIGLFLTMNSKIFFIILLLIIAFGDGFIFYKYNERNRIRQKEKNRLKEMYNKILEKIMAECLDYTNIIENNKNEIENLFTFLRNLDENNFIKGNNERNIRIGD